MCLKVAFRLAFGFPEDQRGRDTSTNLAGWRAVGNRMTSFLAYRVNSLLLLGWLLLALPPTVCAQSTITGRVLEQEHHTPLPNVHIELFTVGGERTQTYDAVTGTDGRFDLPTVPADRWTIRATYFIPSHRIAVSAPPILVEDQHLDLRIMMPTAYVPWLDANMAYTGQKTLSTITGYEQKGEIRGANSQVWPGVETVMIPARQGTLYGQVSSNGRPLANATVMLNDSLHTQTSPSGWFELSNLTPATYRLHVHAAPYPAQTFAIRVDATYQQLHLDLSP